MPLALNLFKKTLKFPVLWVSLIYLFWWILIPTDKSFSDGIGILIMYFIITVLEILLGKNKILSIVLFIILLPITWLFSIDTLELWFSTVWWLNRDFIYLPLIILSSSYILYNLFQRPSNENKTLRTLVFIATLPILAMNIAYPITCFPDVLDQKEFRNFKYYIVSGLDEDYKPYVFSSFYKCKKWSFKCDYLSTDMNVDKIIIDKERNEVSAVNSNLGLGYTDGNNPRVYEAYSVQLGEHVYQMAINAREFMKCIAPSCDSYTYTLYECNLDYTSCDLLPVQYSTTVDDYGWNYLEVNEATNEINAYNRNDNLIFTYGAHPVCYVDKCVILDH